MSIYFFRKIFQSHQFRYRLRLNANKIRLIEHWNPLHLLTRTDYKGGLHPRRAGINQQEISNDFHSVGLSLPPDETSGKCY